MASPDVKMGIIYEGKIGQLLSMRTIIPGQTAARKFSSLQENVHRALCAT
jgi:predicted unusual protein kinase regulating ubiquinone biosynthesis (AarF/ABC1/UbiB family)